MLKKIAFLHTVPAMVEVFNSFLEPYEDRISAVHLVDPTLLEDAMSFGFIDNALKLRIESRIYELMESKVDLVVCTCSSIGAVAEEMNVKCMLEIQRIDRAMADEAVARASKILLAASVSSTLGPTRDLLQSSAERIGKDIELDDIVISSAWERLQEGNKKAYLDEIADYFLKTKIDADLVVLAQASMSGAKELLGHLDIVFLSSLESGFERAIRSV